MVPLTIMGPVGFVTLEFGSLQTKIHRLSEVGTRSTFSQPLPESSTANDPTLDGTPLSAVSQTT